MTQTTQIILVRHGETTMIQEHRIHGHLDAPLSAKGLLAAQKTGLALRGQTYDAFYCSSLGRAVSTAEIIGEEIGMAPAPLDGLRERYYGWLEGKSLDWFEPDLTGPWYNRILSQIALTFSGEKEHHFSRRVVRAFKEIKERHIGERVLLVVHWGTLSVLTKYFRSEEMKGWQLVGPWTPCGISEVHLNGRGWQIIRLDDHSHL